MESGMLHRIVFERLFLKKVFFVISFGTSIVIFNGSINLKAETIAPISRLEEAFGIVYLRLLFIMFYDLNIFNYLKNLPPGFQTGQRRLAEAL